MTDFIFTLSVPLPPKELSPNARLHWRPVADAKKNYRKQCWAMCLAQNPPKFGGNQLPVEITFYPPNKRKRDKDNLIAAFKAGQDGIADALGIDDALWVQTYHMGVVTPPEGRIGLIFKPQVVHLPITDTIGGGE